MEIVIDSRESKLKEIMTKKNYVYKVEQLNVGDVVFRNEETKEILLICERKTMADLYNSIITGRYRDQKERLEKSGCKICYIFENIKLSFSNLKQSVVIRGAIENLALYHSIPIILTASTSDTACSIDSIRKKLEKNSSFSSSVTTKFLPAKKKKISENMFQNQLELISGVSPNIAIKIVEKYKSLRNLMNEYAKAEDKENLLSKIIVGKRKIGPVLSKRIFTTFYAD